MLRQKFSQSPADAVPNGIALPRVFLIMQGGNLVNGLSNALGVEHLRASSAVSSLFFAGLRFATRTAVPNLFCVSKKENLVLTTLTSIAISVAAAITASP